MKISNPKEKGRQYPLKDLVRDIWFYAGNRRKSLVLGTIIRACGDISGLYPAYALGIIVTSLTNHTFGLPKLFLYVGLLGAAYLTRHICIYYAKKMIYYTAQTIWATTEKHMVNVLISKDSAWHEKESSGVKIKRIERGALSYKDILYNFVNYYVEVTISFIGIPYVLFKFDSKIAFLMIAFVIIYFIISKYLQKKCIRAAHEFNVEEDELNGSIYEVVSNIRTIRVLHVGSEMLGRINSFMDRALRALRKRIVAFQSRASSMAIFANSFKTLVLFYIVYLIFQGRYEVGLIVVFAAYFDKIWEQVRELTDISQEVVISRQSITRMYDLIGKEIIEEKGKEEFPKNWDALYVDKLSFSYGESQALNNISFTVKNGEKVGIVGLSGAGKSTLFKLLIKERTDYTGAICIGGVRIEDITSDTFYQHVSIVPQDTEVFNFSLKENITIAQPSKEHDQDLLDRSLEISHVKEFLGKLTQGVDTLIGERGVKLSGGERQRLGIARAIFKEPEILLLDEATSHLDLESEEKIKDSLHKFFENVTAIVIAHRLTTIKEMDSIIVIEGGAIIEQGSYDELMAKKTRFYELWQKQLL